MRDPSKRLGCGPEGADAIKRHPFFKAINWAKLDRREIESKFRPQVRLTILCVHQMCASLRACAQGREIWKGELSLSVAPLPFCCMSSEDAAFILDSADALPQVDCPKSIENFDKIWTDQPPEDSPCATPGSHIESMFQGFTFVDKNFLALSPDGKPISNAAMPQRS